MPKSFIPFSFSNVCSISTVSPSAAKAALLQASCFLAPKSAKRFEAPLGATEAVGGVQWYVTEATKIASLGRGVAQILLGWRSSFLS
jgi:hypothetical protein